ncbi:MAG: hypothetical protein QOE02_442 [Rhodospirillaceae bacterium]|nr:hypothetical protein [Rhodospirillaceae bacterium]MEA2850423.1 hypothetical protein [Rhodospirillaceae bacterium]
MLSAAEIARGVQGALGFLKRDATAPQHFDNTMEACLRSFRVMALVAPLYAIYLLIYYSDVTVNADGAEIAVVEAMRYIVDWLLFPVIFYEAARRRGWLDRYPRYIGALNWINLPAMVVVIVGQGLSSVAPAAVAVVIDLGLRALLFYWFLMATRMALGTSWPISVVLLIINWVPSLFLSFLVDRYLGVVPIAGGG